MGKPVVKKPPVKKAKPLTAIPRYERRIQAFKKNSTFQLWQKKLMARLKQVPASQFEKVVRERLRKNDRDLKVTTHPNARALLLANEAYLKNLLENPVKMQQLKEYLRSRK